MWTDRHSPDSPLVSLDMEPELDNWADALRLYADRRLGVCSRYMFLPSSDEMRHLAFGTDHHLRTQLPICRFSLFESIEP